jgi:hypothetical protein
MSCADIYADVQKRKLLLNSEVVFGYITWQSILRELRKLNTGNPFYNVILNDLIDLLSRKGFDQFSSMQIQTEYQVDINMHFKFDCENKESFIFITAKDIIVNEGVYYEFK